jgi:hypothetical protein
LRLCTGSMQMWTAGRPLFMCTKEARGRGKQKFFFVDVVESSYFIVRAFAPCKKRKRGVYRVLWVTFVRASDPGQWQAVEGRNPHT